MSAAVPASPAPPAPSVSSQLPTGTVTFLFTDVEGSTKLLNADPDAYRRAVRRHHDLLLEAVHLAGGAVFETVGDAVYAAFSRATDAVKAALWGQLSLGAEDWGETPIKVRMGIHLGEAELQGEHYFGAPLYRCARLMSTAHGGQVVLSEVAAASVRDALPEDAALKDLGEHRLKDLARPERVSQLLHPELPADFPALRSLDSLPNNLPLQLTSFVGRERELAEVARHLGVARLLTLTGAGGSGKTRLALQAAADALEDHPDGVWLVELASLADPAQVPLAVAAALSLHGGSGREPLTALVDALRARHLLLVLDNCEHLVAACAELAETLLRSCPGLHVLATSREPLGIAGETTWRVPSLALPQPDRLPPLEALTQYEAVRLFIDRAKAALPGFAVTDATAPAVAQICHRLDGIPLAIELAAARVRVLDPDQLLARLDQRFRLLTGGSRTALPRQQTLQALVDWSYGLLSHEEKTLFNRLAVFSGGFTLEAAEQVCAGGGVDEYDVLDHLTRLADKSLVVADEAGPAGGRRYRLLETLRQYARQKLLDSGTGEPEAAHSRHAEHFLAVAERAEPEVRGPDGLTWLDLLEREHDNLRAALVWFSGPRGDPVRALRLAAALGWFWSMRSHRGESIKQLAACLDAAPDAPAAVRARALEHKAWMEFWASHPDGLTTSQACVDAARASADERVLARALARHAFVLSNSPTVGAGAPADVQLPVYEEAVALARRVGDLRAEADAHTARMRAHMVTHRLGGDLAAAEPEIADAVGRAIALYRELGDEWGLCLYESRAAELALRIGDLDRAEFHFAERLRLGERLKFGGARSDGWAGLGRVAGARGDLQRAAECIATAITVWTEMGQTATVAHYRHWEVSLLLHTGRTEAAAALLREWQPVWLDVPPEKLGESTSWRRALSALALLACRRGETARAAVLLGACQTHAAPDHPPLNESPEIRTLHAGNLAAVREALAATGEDFDSHVEQGAALTMEQAYALALGELALGERTPGERKDPLRV